MNKWMIGLGLLGMSGALVFADSPEAPSPPETRLETYAQPRLQDLSAQIAILSKQDDELRKIGKDYVEAYRLTSQEIECKEPDRVRFQGKRGILTVRAITNGNRRLFEATGIPLLKHRKVEDISQKPGKADTISDLGVVTPGWLARVQSEWVRAEEREGKTLQVFRWWYQADPGFRHTIWVDPASRTVVEHVYHHRDVKAPSFRKKLAYSDVLEAEGVRIPTRVTIYNGEEREAAVMRYEKVRVNTGLPDKLFEW